MVLVLSKLLGIQLKRIYTMRRSPLFEDVNSNLGGTLAVTLGTNGPKSTKRV